MNSVKRYREYLWTTKKTIPKRSRARYIKQLKRTKKVSESSDSDSELDLNKPRHEPRPNHANYEDLPNNEINEQEANFMEIIEEPIQNMDMESGEESCDRTSTDESDELSDIGDINNENNTKSDMDELLYVGSHLSKKESMLLIMAHILRHHTSDEATSSLLQLIRWHLPKNTTSSFPITKYLFNNFFKSPQPLVQPYFYCPNSACKSNYLGPKEVENELSCDICQSNFNDEMLLKDGSYFLVFDVKSQIQNLLELCSPDLTKTEAFFDISDITKSQKYRNLNLNDKDVTITWNTDGVPVFKSSKYDIWPLQFTVNELPLAVRQRNTLCAGLWFGQKKPNMNCFLKPFVELINLLSLNGIVWTNKEGIKIISRVFPGPCTVDTIARCTIQNTTQFNGEYGCPWCYHPGIMVQKGNGNIRVYPYNNFEKMNPRTNETFMKDAKKAVNRREIINGVKGPSILLKLNKFDLAEDVVVDYMHCLCLGVVRTTTNLWLDSKSHYEVYYLGNSLKVLDNRLLKIKVPKEFSRKPRSFETRAFWKASEWRAWALFYSPIVLKGLLPSQFFKNWMRLIMVFHVLLGRSVPVNLLFQVRKVMSEFLIGYENLYGVEYMLFNVHQLLHLVDCAANWGPIWSFSAFPFESNNGRLLKLFHGTQYIQTQISQRFLFMQYLPTLVLKNEVFRENLLLRMFFDSLTNNYSQFPTQKILSHNKKTIVLGKTLPANLKKDESVLLIENGIDPSTAILHKKITINGVTFSAVCGSKKTENCYVCREVENNDTFFKISQIYSILEGKVYISAQKLKIVNLNEFTVVESGLPQVIFPCEVTMQKTLFIIDKETLKKCIVMRKDSKEYLIKINVVLDGN